MSNRSDITTVTIPRARASRALDDERSQTLFSKGFLARVPAQIA